MSITDLNTLARRITLKEGLKKSLSIGQVKEVMRLFLIELKDLSLGEITRLLGRYKK